MWRNYKIKLHNITEDQRRLLFKTINAFRFTYNWGLNYRKTKYFETGKGPSKYEMLSEFTAFRNQPGNEWLLEIESSTCRYALMNVNNAYNMHFVKNNRWPKFHTKKKAKKSFQVRNDRLRFCGKNNRYVRIPGFGRSDEMLIDCKRHSIPVGPNVKYHNVCITYDGIDFWLSLSVSSHNPIVYHHKVDDVLGIDVGFRTSAYLSNGVEFEAPDQDRLKLLENRRRRLQGAISKDILRRKEKAKRAKTKYDSIQKSQNELKRESKLRKTYHDIHNIYDNHYHQISRRIADMRYSTVVLETLGIRKLQKTGIAARKRIQNRPLYSLIEYISYKCEYMGTKVIFAENGFKSTQICSCCGNINDVKRSKTYICVNCGNIMDRDLNAAINLRNYGKEALLQEEEIG